MSHSNAFNIDNPLINLNISIKVAQIRFVTALFKSANNKSILSKSMLWEAKILLLSKFVMSTRNKGIISQLATCNKARSYKSGNIPKGGTRQNATTYTQSIAELAHTRFEFRSPK